jgi:subtilisin family serine protease
LDKSFSPERCPHAGASFETIDVMEIIGARAAWTLVTPDKGVIIAILDDGVDVHHPDLEAACIVAPAFFNGIRPTRDSDSHGTACAGLAAAWPGTPGGMRGVAGGCSILPIRVGARTDPPDPVTICFAIRWAIDQGARIINMSWSSVRYSSVGHVIDDYADQALFVAAAGNEDGPVTFPANHPGVMAVSACDGHGEPKTPHSPDGEPWGTNHGPEVEIAAPGVALSTTRLSGHAGAPAGSYLHGYGGTSAAAALVSGAAALVLSCNPALTAREVRKILRDTAGRIGGDYPGGHDEYMGYGRLDVSSAVREAEKLK